MISFDVTVFYDKFYDKYNNEYDVVYAEYYYNDEVDEVDEVDDDDNNIDNGRCEDYPCCGHTDGSSCRTARASRQ